MNSSTPEQEKWQLVGWWFLWAAFQAGIFTFYHFMSRKISVDPTRLPPPEPAPWMVGALPFAVSVLIRFFILPRMKNSASALPVFVVGMALAETTCFLGLFVFPSHQRELFILSAVGIFQYIPVYAHRFFQSENQ